MRRDSPFGGQNGRGRRRSNGSGEPQLTAVVAGPGAAGNGVGVEHGRRWPSGARRRWGFGTRLAARSGSTGGWCSRASTAAVESRREATSSPETSSRRRPKHWPVEDGARGSGRSSGRVQWARAEVLSTVRWSGASSASRGHGGEHHRGDELGHDGGSSYGARREARGEGGKGAGLTVLLQMCSSVLEEGSVRRNRRRSSSEKRRKTAT